MPSRNVLNLAASSSQSPASIDREGTDSLLGTGRPDELDNARLAGVRQGAIMTLNCPMRPAVSEQSNLELSQKRALASAHDRIFNRLRNTPSGPVTRALTVLCGNVHLGRQFHFLQFTKSFPSSQFVRYKSNAPDPAGL